MPVKASRRRDCPGPLPAWNHESGPSAPGSRARRRLPVPRTRIGSGTAPLQCRGQLELDSEAAMRSSKLRSGRRRLSSTAGQLEGPRPAGPAVTATAPGNKAAAPGPSGPASELRVTGPRPAQATGRNRQPARGPSRRIEAAAGIDPGAPARGPAGRVASGKRAGGRARVRRCKLRRCKLLVTSAPARPPQHPGPGPPTGTPGRQARGHRESESSESPLGRARKPWIRWCGRPAGGGPSPAGRHRPRGAPRPATQGLATAVT